MTHQAPLSPDPAAADPARQLAQLRELLHLVERISGGSPARLGDEGLEDAAGLSLAYDRAPPIVQRRFDARAREVSGWAAAGVEALIAAGGATPPRAAADRLALRLQQALRDLSAICRPAPDA